MHTTDKSICERKRRDTLCCTSNKVTVIWQPNTCMYMYMYMYIHVHVGHVQYMYCTSYNHFFPTSPPINQKIVTYAKKYNIQLNVSVEQIHWLQCFQCQKLITKDFHQKQVNILYHKCKLHHSETTTYSLTTSVHAK